MAQLRLLFHRGHHAFEFPQPQLLTQVHPGHRDFFAVDQGGSAPRMGDQGEQAFEQQHPVRERVALTKTQLLGEPLQ